jgi:hypothetical protein
MGRQMRKSDGNEQQMRRLASMLLDQQMWCWGRDIVRGEGNLLVQFGFRKERPPANVVGCTAYILTPFPGCQLVLWGFGFFFGLASSGGMFLRRYEFNPVWAAIQELPAIVWCADALPVFHAPQSPRECRWTQRLLTAAVKWIAGYEQWVLDSVGIDYRRSCLRQWHKKAVPAELVADAWRRIGVNCHELAAAERNEAMAISTDL